MSTIKHFWRGFREGAGEFGLTVNVLITSALLLVVYLLGVGITSVIAKCAGKRFLQSGSEQPQNTYWSSLSRTIESTDDYYKQF